MGLAESIVAGGASYGAMIEARGHPVRRWDGLAIFAVAHDQLGAG
jgi:hypothetical protein